MLGYSEQELHGRTFADLVSPERQAEQRDRIARLFRGESEPSSAEWQFLRKDGSAIWVILSLAPADGEVVGETLAVGHVQDISTRKQARGRAAPQPRKTRRGRARRTAGKLGMGHHHRPNHVVRRPVPRLRAHPGRVRPQLSEDASNASTPTTESSSVEQSNKPSPNDHRSRSNTAPIRADGRVHTLRSRGEVVVDDSGEPIRLVGIAQDITDAKLAQEALQSTSADLERRATELQQLALRTATEPQPTPHAPLTPRQLEILRLIAQGLTNAAIAERLVVTESTVKWHVKQILAKTASANRTEAVARVLGTPQ